jgi:hypothetical protein
MRLSKRFVLKEFERSDTAERLGIDNSVPDNLIPNVQNLVDCILQPLAQEVGGLRVNSGYRSPELNRAVRGAATSQHLQALAADIEAVDTRISNYDLACLIRDNYDFDQLILEFYTPGKPDSGWVHVSIAEDRTKNRNQALTIGKGVNKKGIHF